MADRLWYALLKGEQKGPFTEAQMRDMIARGEVAHDTLVWAADMPDWAKAAEIPGLMPLPPPFPAPGIVPRSPLPPGPMVSEWPGGEPGQPLAFSGGTWGLLGWTLLAYIGQLFVIPSPWTATGFIRWMTQRIQLPNGKSVWFEGRPGDIWYIFVGLAVIGLLGLVHFGFTLLLLPLAVYFYLSIYRWFFANLAWHGRTAPLSFRGRYLPLLGWWAFYWVSLISLIGWAWVLTAMTRWVCRNVEGSSKKLTFTASGWSVLWRFVVAVFASILIIPIPWILKWLARWMLSQFALSNR